MTDGAAVAGATETISLSGVTATGNARYSLNDNVASSSNAYLLMDPARPSTLTGPVNLNFGNTANAVASLTGTFQFNGNTSGNGLTANFSNAQTAVFYLNGLGNSTADNNSLGGINVNMNSVKNASVSVSGFSSISGNGGDGLAVSMNSVTKGKGALELQGVTGGTNMTGNGGNGVNVQINNYNLIDGFTPTLPTIIGLTTTSNLAAPLNSLPAPTALTIPTSTPANAFAVNNFSVSGSGLGGVIVDGVNSTITTGHGSMSNNLVTGSQNGDGIRLSLHNNLLTNPTADSFAFRNNSSTSNANGNGINIDLIKATMNNMDLTGSMNVSNNALNGLRINLNQSSITPTTDITNLTANSNGQNGVYINAINASNIFIDAAVVTANGNTGAGFVGTALSGSTMNVCLDRGSLSNNGLQGMSLTVDGAGTTASFNSGPTTLAGTGVNMNGNTDQGLLAVVTNGAVLNYRSINSSYNNNGTTTASDGVDMRADGTGSTIRTLFYGGTASGNGRDGYHFGGLSDGASTNNANFTTSFSGVTSSGNGRDSLNFDVLNANTAYLLMDPTNASTFSGPINLEYTGVQNAIANLKGVFHFDNNAGDGLTANFSNVNSAIFSLDGTGTSTANNNGGDGIHVTMTNVGVSSVYIAGFSSISNNAGDGIEVGINNVSVGSGAIQLQGVPAGTTMSTNGGDGINVHLANVNLVNNLNTSPIGTTLGLTTTSSQPSPLDCIPLPVTLSLNTLATIPSTGLTITKFNADHSGQGGIIVDGSNTTVATNGGAITNNNVSNSQNGDGIRLSLHNTSITNPTANGFNFSNNSSINNLNGNGINIDLLRATMDNMNLTGSTPVTGNALNGLRINLDQSSMTPTTPLTALDASNNGQNGVFVNSVNGSTVFLDLGVLTADGNGGSGFVGNALAGSVMNIAIGSPSSTSGNAHQGINLAVGTGSSSSFNVNSLNSNNNTDQGLLATVTNGGVLNYRSTNSTYNNNGVGSDGVDMRLDGATTTIRALFTGGSANGNGRDGYHFGGLTDAGSVNGASLTVNMSGVTATGNTRDSLNMGAMDAASAYLLMDPAAPATLSGPANFDFTNVNNAIAALTGTFNFDNSGASNGLTAKFSKATNAILYVDGLGTSTASGNALGGINVSMTDSANASVVIKGFSNVSNNTGGDGIGVTMNNTSTGTGALEIQGVAGGTTMTANGGNGVNVQLNNFNMVSGINPTLPTITGLTTTDNLVAPQNKLPAPVPLTVDVSTMVPTNAFAVNDLTVSSSALGGIIVDATNVTMTTGGGSISNNTVSNSQNGDGIQFVLHNGALVNPTADNFAFTNNSSTGNINGNGINIDLVNATMNNLDLTGSTPVSGNSLDGLHINLNNSSVTPTTPLTSLTANNNGQNGVYVNAVNNSNIFLDLGALTANGNTQAGFVGNALSGSTLNITMGNPASLQNNGAQGLALTVNGSGSVSNFNVNTLTANGNTDQGLLATVSAGGVLNYRSVNSTYNNNGTTTANDGVDIRMDGSSTIVRALFSGDSATGNGRDGLHFGGLTDGGSVNGAALTVNLSGVTSTGNARDSLNVGAQDASAAYVLTDPAAPLTLSGPANLDFTNVNSAIATLTGTFNFDNNTAGNGLTANFSNALNAILYVDGQGTSTADGNSGGGVIVSMTNAQNAAVTLKGFSSVSNNTGGDGIGVTMNNTTAGSGAVQIQGIAGGTTIAGNGGNGVNVQLNNFALVNNFAPTLLTITGLTTTDNMASPYDKLPTPVPETVDVTTIVPASAFAINDLTVSNSGLGGIIVDGTDTTIQIGGGSIANNTVTGSQNGDGIRLSLHNTVLTSPTADGFAFTNNNSSNNVNGSGINIDLLNATMNFLNLTGSTTVSGNTLDGLRINLDNSSVYPTQDLTTLVASTNGQNGVEINALNNSVIFLDVQSITASSNTGAGFVGSSTGGSSLNVCLDTGSVSTNGTQGININVDGTGSNATFNLGPVGLTGAGVTVDFNTDQGLLTSVTNGGDLNYRSINSTYNSNGTVSTNDGVDMRVDGAGSTIRTLFYGGSANNNGRDGYHFGGLTDGGSTNGATLTVSLSGVNSAGNPRYAMNFDALNAFDANLLMDPSNPSTLVGNNNVVVTGVTDNVVLQLDGVSFASGLNLTFDHSATGINSAFVSLNGEGTATIDGGVSVTMLGLTNGSVLIDNYASINNTAGDGIAVTIDGSSAPAGFTNAAIELKGATTGTSMAVTGGSGVNVQLTDTKLLQNLASSASLPTIIGLTPIDNQSAPQDCLPAPVPLALNALNVIPSDALTISNLNIAGSGAGGINGIIVTGTDSTVAANDSFITNNSVSGTFSGDAISVAMTNTGTTGAMINGLLIDSNTVTGTLGAPIAGDGITVSVMNTGAAGSAADNITITNNTVTGVGGDGIAFQVINPSGSPSTANAFVIDSNTVTGNTGFGLNLDLQYVNSTGSSFSNDSFSSNGSDGVQMNLLSATLDTLTTTGNTIDGNTGNGLQAILNASSITNWSASGSLSDNALNGLLISASNTSSVTATTFTNTTIDRNGSDGVQFLTTDATTSTFGTITFTGGSISDNGQTAGSGVNLNTVANGSTFDLAFTNEQINNTLPGTTQQNGLIYAIASTGGVVNATFTDSSISNNSVDAINSTISGSGSQSTIILTGTTADGSGSTGALFNLSNAATLTFTVQDDAGTRSSISSGLADGVQINATGANTNVTATFTNSDISGNGIASGNNGVVGNFDADATGTLTFTGMNLIGNGSATSGGDAVLLNINQNTIGSLTNVIANFTSSSLSNNGASALEGNVTGAAGGPNPTTGLQVLFDGVTADGNSGMGVAFNASNGALVTFDTQNLTSISGNGQNGVYISATDADTLVAISLQDTTINNNGGALFPGDGLNGTVLNGATLNIEASTSGLGPMSFSGNAGDGIDVLVADANSRSDIDLHNVFAGASAADGFAGNTLNGTKFQAIDGGTVNLRAYDTRFDGNQGGGLSGTVNNTLGVDTSAIVRIIGGSADNNGGDGYSLVANNTFGPPTTATITGQFQADDANVGISAQGNGGYGLNFVAQNPVAPYGGVVGNLLMTGASNLSGNTSGSVNVLMDGADQAIVGLSGTFDGNTGNGIDVTLTHILGLGLVSLQGPGTVSNNGGNGINVTLDQVHNGGVFIGGFSAVSNNGQDGIKVTMTDVGHNFGSGSGVGALTIDGQTTAVPGNVMAVSNNGNNGVNIQVNTGSIIDNNTFNTSVLTSNMVNLIDYTPPDAPILPPLPNPLLTTSLQNVSNALGITIANTVAVQNLDLESNGATNTAGSGVLLSVDNSTLVGIPTINNNTIANTGAGGTTNNGIKLTLANAASVDGLDVVNNTISGSRGDGVNVFRPNFVTSTANPFALSFTGNSITGNTGNGVNINMPTTGAAPSLLNPKMDITFTNNSVTNNTLNGVLLELAGQPNSAAIANISFLSDSGTANPFSGNFSNDISGNGGMGALITATDNASTDAAQVNLTIGGTGAVNTFSGNGDAGVGMNLAGKSKGTATVANASFTGTLFKNTHGANFQGDGFSVFVNNDATFNGATFGNSTQATTFSGNAGSGFRLATSLRGSSGLSGPGITIQDATITGNSGNGLTFLRNAGVITPGAYISNVTIDSNTITGNQIGISMSAEFADGTDTYTITNNTVSNNRSHGISMFTLADADLTTTIDTNQINNNGGDGIHATQNLGTTDVGLVTSTITNNTITFNSGNGINAIALQTITIGGAGALDPNTITNNTLAGITLTGSTFPFTTDSIIRNAINNNGGNGITINSVGSFSVDILSNNALASVPGGGFGGVNNNGGDGIQLNAVGSLISATVDANDVFVSGGDGVQLLVSNSGTTSSNSVAITNNDIEQSTRRGINVLTAADNRTNLQIDSNIVTRSQLEGVYIVNTSTPGQLGATTVGVQGIDELANTAMATGNTWLNDPRLALTMHDNLITSNGQVSNGTVFNATGLVIRIGSSDASNSYTDDGGFASSYTSAGAGGTMTNATVVSTAFMTRGGVVANIFANQFGGDYNSDVTFQAFRSTNDPPTTNGTWTDNNDGNSAAVPPVPRNPANDIFQVNSYTSDPLSRFDLRFTNTNTGDGMLATRTDFFSSTNPGFYNNAEDVFKSRTKAQDGNDPPVGGANQSGVGVGDDGGPFNSGTRDRNLTRQASNASPFDNPQGVGSVVDVATNGFLYPGVSNSSTFRRSADTSSAGFTLVPPGTGFGSTVLDPQNQVGALSFKWDVLP